MVINSYLWGICVAHQKKIAPSGIKGGIEMKIIKQGTPLNQITCKKCGCIFEYEETDIIEDTRIDMGHFDIAMNSTKRVIGEKFVICPNCEKKHVIKSEVISSKIISFEERLRTK